MIEGFDGAAGFKNFTEDNRFHSRGSGQYWLRRIVFATESPSFPHFGFAPGNKGPASLERSAPHSLSEPANRATLNRLFGKCNGPETTVRVRDLLYGKPSAPGVTILEAQPLFHLSGRGAGGNVSKWPRQNHFTTTKKGARLSYRQRPNGAFGPELKELSGQHVYVVTIHVAGYEVLELPIPRAENVDIAVGSDDSFMSDVSNLSMGSPVATTPASVRGPAGKRMKQEVKSETPVPELKVKGGVPEGYEEKGLSSMEENKAETEGGDLFEVSTSCTLRWYIYKKVLSRA